MTTDDDGQIRIPRWLQGVIATILLGAITQGVLIYSSLQTTNVKLQHNASALDKLESRLHRMEERLQTSTVDRWTRADHTTYAAGVRAEVAAVEAELRTHKSEPGHASHLRDFEALVSRVARVEEDLRRLEAKLGQ